MLTKQKFHHCTISPDDALCTDRGPSVICDGQSVHAAVLSAVANNLKAGVLLFHADQNIWPRAGTLDSPARAGGQSHPLRRDSTFGLPLPGYHSDIFKGSVLHPSFQKQSWSGDHVHRLFVDDVHWYSEETTWHWAGTRHVTDEVMNGILDSSLLTPWAVGFETLCIV